MGNRWPDLLKNIAVRGSRGCSCKLSFLYIRCSVFVTMCHHAFLLEHLAPVLDISVRPCQWLALPSDVVSLSQYKFQQLQPVIGNKVDSPILSLEDASHNYPNSFRIL